MKKLFVLPFIGLISFNAFSSEAIGFYSKGSQAQAQSVFERGTPIHKLFLSRQRHYTSDEMHEVLTNASEFITDQFPDSAPLQVGDLSLKLGGLAQGHASHQNGLDSDLVYLRLNKHVQSPAAQSWDEDFVVGAKPSGNFSTERNFKLFKHLVETSPIARIFVDLAIKKSLCDYVLKTGGMSDPQSIQTLRRLRPQNLHRTHFHLRLSCPPEDLDCIPQTEPDAGTGCDELTLLLEEAAFDKGC